MRFSQRIGVSPLEKVLQVDSIDDDLRNSLWSVLTIHYWEKFSGYEDRISGSNLEPLFNCLWLLYFKKPIDAIPDIYYGNRGVLAFLRDYFFKAKWYEVYEFVEFIDQYGPDRIKQNFIRDCNTFLERENSGYRFVDGKIVEITSPEEIDEIENAIASSVPYYGVRQHLVAAITLLSNKENPNYRNSIKESISAVESLCRTVSNNEKATLGEALKVLEKNGVVHPALKAAFSSLYGYTNDADGIRHALMEEENLGSADARFMLISCSAFVNYVIASIDRVG